MNSEPITSDTPGPGIYDGVPFSTYCRWDAVNFSRLKRMSISPSHYKTDLHIDTSATIFGRLAHSGKLEAASVPLLYAVMPAFEFDSANKDAKDKPSTSPLTKYCRDKKAAFIEANAGREIITAKHYADMVATLEALEANPRACEYLNTPGRTELSYIWIDPDTGLKCKARADKVNSAINDLKTTADIDQFEKSIIKFEYHRQAAHYTDGWRILTGEDLPFRIVAVSKSQPIAVRSAPIHPDAIRTGQSQNRIDLDRVAECMASGIWPNIPDPDAWELPEWYVNRIMDDQLVEFDE